LSTTHCKPAQDGGGGGGAGCHFDNYNLIDQTDAKNGGLNLMQDSDCQCQYKFKQKNNWGDWVDQWMNYAHNPKSLDQWFAKGKSPSHGLDQVSCWMNNPRDMINLQNMIYWKRYWWSNQLAPASSWDNNNAASLRPEYELQRCCHDKVACSPVSRWDWGLRYHCLFKLWGSAES